MYLTFHISNLHVIPVSVLLILGSIVFVFWVKNIWRRKKRNILIFTFLLILLLWYLIGLSWRLQFFQKLTSTSLLLRDNASPYYFYNNELPPDISSLLTDELLLKMFTEIYLLSYVPQLGLKWVEGEEQYYLQIYWYGFDKDDDQLEDYKFPGWFRLIYFPWNYNGDIYITGDFFNKDNYKKRKEMEKELLLVKSTLLLHDAITQNELELVKKIKKKPQIEGEMDKIYSAIISTFKQTYTKGWKEESINSYLEEIKKKDHPPIDHRIR